MAVIRYATVKEHHPNGRLHTITRLRDIKGVRQAHGPSRIYYADGTLQYDTSFKADQPHGTWRAFHPDGSLNFTAVYQNGVLQDIEYTTMQSDRDNVIHLPD